MADRSAKNCWPKPPSVSIRVMRQLLLAFALTFAAATSLEAAYPRLNQIEPQGAQRGTEATVVLRGDRVGKDPKEILWHDPGIEVRELKPLDDNQVEAKLFLPP